MKIHLRIPKTIHNWKMLLNKKNQQRFMNKSQGKSKNNSNKLNKWIKATKKNQKN